ncbi:hypothetical protein EHS25_002997 [Saitozyma podzolica]|uniref:E3 ubiquitin-protein ligase listerin n=1 Tax=Saitozyma podzolica TaxID=1890683 RepID=A0A427YC57_9TREE|nr:hypothetical protein EHS25_002997 [Saitozyma podzolica]
MPKQSKSSASAGTRKKHASKKSGKDGDGDAGGGSAGGQRPPKEKGQKKLSKAQKKALPKVKQYIPPPKPPAPPIPDPLDGQGLARTLPAELVVVLRRLGKKDEVTRRKGLEEMREGWVGMLKQGDEVEQEIRETALVSAVPVWLHNLASLLQSPFHRSLALQLHAELLSVPSNRDVIGSWMVAALEEGRRAGGTGLRSWEDSVAWTEQPDRIDLVPQLSSLAEYLSLSILDPPSLHDDIHPAPVSSAPIPQKAVKGAKGRPTPAPTPPPVLAEEESVLEERWARYRVGGLTGLAWLVQQLSKNGVVLPQELLELLRHPILWSAVSSVPSDDSIGAQQPTVRKAAYALLDALVDSFPDEVAKSEMLELLSTAVLDCVWLEKEAAVWQQAGAAVVKFLSKYKDCWEIARRAETREGQSSTGPSAEDPEGDGDEDEEGGDDDDDEEDEDGEGETNGQQLEASAPKATSKAYGDFLQFIATTCPSIPHLTYPLLLVVISTIPDTLLPLEGEPSPALRTLFGHLWSPVDARLLSTHSLPGQASAYQTFFQDFVDCTVFLVGKASRSEDGRMTAEWLVKEQLGERAWAEGVLQLGSRGGRRRGGQDGSEAEATIFGKALGRLASIQEDLARILMPLLSQALIAACFESTSGEAGSSILPRSLRIVSAVRESCTDGTMGASLDALVGDLAQRSAERLASLVHSELPEAAVYAEHVVESLTEHPLLIGKETQEPDSFLNAVSPALVIALLAALSGSQAEGSANTLWSLIKSTEVPRDTRFALAQGVLDAPSARLIYDGSLDCIALEATQVALSEGTLAATALAKASVRRSELSVDALHTVLALVCTAIHDSVHSVLTDSPDAASPPPPLPDAAMEVFAAYAGDHPHEIIHSDVYTQALVAVHHAAYLFPRLDPSVPAPAVAGEVFSRFNKLSPEQEAIVGTGIVASLAELVSQVSCKASSPDITLPIINPLVPCSSEQVSEPADVDTAGRSRAARYAEAALALLRADRHLAETNHALLQMVLEASILAQDALAVPGASRGLFGPSTRSSHLSDFVREAEGTLSYALASVDDVPLAWHSATAQSFKSTDLADTADFVQKLLWNLAQDVVLDGGDVAARVLGDVLSRQLRQSGAGEKEAEAWLAFAPQLALALILAVKPLLLDTKSFETAQNRLASAVTTIPAKSANSKGIPALRLLIASAPPRDAPSVFLPQQRAVFVLRHVGGWLTSDEADDLDEEIEYRLAQLYTALAPIVQDLSGGHWDSIFDLVDSGLEIRDLCSTNKSLRALWTGKDAQLGLVLKLFLQCRDADSVPVQMIQALLLDLLQDVPNAAMEATGIAELVDLLRLSTSFAIQSTAYRILSRVIRSRTLALVLEVEASVAEAEEGLASRTIALPQELEEVVRYGVDVDWHGEVSIPAILGQLLAWMAILDHFDDASRTLRWAYLDQLNSSQLLTQGLLPLLFAVLGISEVGAWNFPASSYAVDEFYPDLLEPEDLPDLAPLASHVFYRTLVTLPSVMRTYYEGLKDRQLSMSMLAFTARHYSPVIIAHEFSALRQPSAMAQLTEEGLNVRIAQGGGATVAAGGGSAEAIASYVVDEQPMEIGIRLPAEFPLKGVDVRDLRRVGVPENKWRGWLMSIQQTVTSRNGLMLEALTVFKKNVALHFEGVVECAICYSPAGRARTGSTRAVSSNGSTARTRLAVLCVGRSFSAGKTRLPGNGQAANKSDMRLPMFPA